MLFGKLAHEKKVVAGIFPDEKELHSVLGGVQVSGLDFQQVLQDIEKVGATSPMVAPMYLEEAAAVMKDRAIEYDSPTGERSMAKTVTAFNAITGQSLSTSEGWLLLQLLKDVRQWAYKGFHQDSAKDCIAYAALKAEALQFEG